MSGYTSKQFEQLVDTRLRHIREEVRSGDTELTGRYLRDPRAADYVYGAGPAGRRIRGGFHISHPEIADAGLSPARAARAIERGRGKPYQRLKAYARDELLKEMHYPRVRKSRGRGPLVVPPHKKLTLKCRHCGKPHSTSEHRFHGPGAFSQTHLFSFNPRRRRMKKKRRSAAMRRKIGRPRARKTTTTPTTRTVIRRQNPAGQVQIYKATRGVILAGMQKPAGHPCDAKCQRAGHKYQHRFKSPVAVIGLPDGSVKLVPR